MIEANNLEFKYVRMIAKNVNLRLDTSQDIYNYYELFGLVGTDPEKIAAKKAFDNFTSNKLVLNSMGVDVMQAGGSTDQYLTVNVNQLKIYLNDNGINIDNNDINHNHDHNNEDRGSSHVSIHMCVDFSAVLGLSSQNVQDVLIQDVFIVSYLDSDGNVINDAHHFHSSTDVIIW